MSAERTVPTAPRTVPTAGAALGILAGLTWKRLYRGRMIWFIAIPALLPVAVALLLTQGSTSAAHRANMTLGFVQFLFAILAPMLVGSAVGSELGSKSATYLWSRPVPRWTILISKLVVLAPVIAAILVGSWLLALLISGGLISGPALGALAVGALAISVVVAAIAAIGPNRGIAFSLLYVLLIDMGISFVPASIHNLSVTYQTTVLANLPDADGTPATGSPLTAALWLVGMSAVWLVIALRQLRTREV